VAERFCSRKIESTTWWDSITASASSAAVVSAVVRARNSIGDEGGRRAEHTVMVFGQMNEPPGARFRVDHGAHYGRVTSGTTKRRTSSSSSITSSAHSGRQEVYGTHGASPLASRLPATLAPIWRRWRTESATRPRSHHVHSGRLRSR